MENNEVNSESEVATSASAEAPKKAVDCMIHCRFNPDGTVAEIGERPGSVVAQTWFNYLSRHTHNCYQALSGGRGLFRLPHQEVSALKAACLGENAT
ncbi:MAG: hypothetical protein WC782_16405 [Methylococcaceae bacterium]|jgi:hypothetical protein